MKIELEPYDYYYEPIGQQAMMVANGHNGLHATHPFNMEENFLHILGKPIYDSNMFTIDTMIYIDTTASV